LLQAEQSYPDSHFFLPSPKNRPRARRYRPVRRSRNRRIGRLLIHALAGCDPHPFS
jgi:hypothetical protein